MLDNVGVTLENTLLNMPKKNNPVDYEAMIQKALRQVVRDILQDVAHYGLQGDQHFYFTFATNHPWVDLPPYLKEKYPHEMVIVLQNEFGDLEVRSDSFSMSLCFDDDGEERMERITVPFLALINFVDPSQNFGLQFVDVDREDDDEEDQDERAHSSDDEEDASSNRPNVISLDDFRKK